MVKNTEVLSFIRITVWKAFLGARWILYDQYPKICQHSMSTQPNLKNFYSLSWSWDLIPSCIMIQCNSFFIWETKNFSLIDTSFFYENFRIACHSINFLVSRFLERDIEKMMRRMPRGFSFLFLRFHFIAHVFISESNSILDDDLSKFYSLLCWEWKRQFIMNWMAIFFIFAEMTFSCTWARVVIKRRTFFCSLSFGQCLKKILLIPIKVIKHLKM